MSYVLLGITVFVAVLLADAIKMIVYSVLLRRERTKMENKLNTELQSIFQDLHETDNIH